MNEEIFFLNNALFSVIKTNVLFNHNFSFKSADIVYWRIFSKRGSDENNNLLFDIDK